MSPGWLVWPCVLVAVVSTMAYALMCAQVQQQRGPDRVVCIVLTYGSLVAAAPLSCQILAVPVEILSRLVTQHATVLRRLTTAVAKIHPQPKRHPHRELQHGGHVRAGDEPPAHSDREPGHHKGA